MESLADEGQVSRAECTCAFFRKQGLKAGRAIGSKAAVSVSSRGLAYVALHRGQVERARDSSAANRSHQGPQVFG